MRKCYLLNNILHNLDSTLQGIYKFGFKFEQIVKFMPDRNKEQFKDRVRRIYVASFLATWTT